MPLSASSCFALSFLSSARPMPRITLGALVNWMLEYSMISSRLPHGSRKSRKGPSTKRAPAAFASSMMRLRSSTTKPRCRFSTPDRVVGHQGQVDELVAHVDEGVALALAAQCEIEDAAVPLERFIDVADLDRDVIDADEPRFLSFGHDRLRYLCYPGVRAGAALCRRDWTERCLHRRCHLLPTSTAIGNVLQRSLSLESSAMRPIAGVRKTNRR